MLVYYFEDKVQYLECFGHIDQDYKYLFVEGIVVEDTVVEDTVVEGTVVE